MDKIVKCKELVLFIFVPHAKQSVNAHQNGKYSYFPSITYFQKQFNSKTSM